MIEDVNSFLLFNTPQKLLRYPVIDVKEEVFESVCFEMAGVLVDALPKFV
jgi:hypothetical protein